MSHFYTPTGEPRYEVPVKDGSRMRPTTIADARKHGWLPSVNEVLKVLSKPALTKWLIRNGIMAALTTPRKEGENEDAFADRILTEDAENISRVAMDLGTAVHDAIEKAIKGEPYDNALMPYVMPVLLELKALGNVIATEKIVVSDMGFAGRLDCATDGDAVTIVDFKTTGSEFPKSSPWDDHRAQLAAYAKCWGQTGRKRLQTAVVYISTKEPGRVKTMICEDWTRDWEVFYYTFRIWCLKNEVFPSAVH